MAHYPTPAEIRLSLSDEALEALVAALPSYHTAPVNMVTLDLPNVTPDILTAYASLLEAVQAEYPAAYGTPGAIVRPATREELEGHAIQGEQTRVYNEGLQAEQAEQASTK